MNNAANNEIRFLQHSVKKGDLSVRVHYSAGDRYIPGPDGTYRTRVTVKAVTIYARDYMHNMGEIFGDLYQNDTDMMTDYFDKGRVSINEGHPLYETVLKRAQLNEKKDAERRAKRDAKRAARRAA